MMKDNNPSAQPWVATAQVDQTVLPNQRMKQESVRQGMNGARFDDGISTGATLADLKKMQDPEKFNKARFRFRLYKK